MTRLRAKFHFPAALLALAIVCGAVGLQRRREAHPTTSASFSGSTMGGSWSVKLENVPPGIAMDTLREHIAALLARLDGEMSIWKPESDLSRFNEYQGTDWYAVPEDLAQVAAVAQRASVESAGAFDVTVEPLVVAWGFGPPVPGAPREHVPTDAEITEARSHVDYHRLQFRLDLPALKKDDAAIHVDLGGIAKGYAAHQVGTYLQSVGVENYLVAVGGELRAHGAGSDGKPWRVGIETPTPDIRRIIATLDLRDESLSTSGDYRNFFETGGKRFCHEIDPQTGRPVENAPASVSVVDPSGARADAMATALMVLGANRGEELAGRLGIAALFILRRGDHFEFVQSPEFMKLHADISGRQ